jgi:kinesin family member 18/19
MAKIGADIVASDDHMKEMWAGKSNVLVCVRVRPLMKHDKIQKNIVRVLDHKVVVILDPAHGDKGDILRANRNREKQYAFDYAFDPSCSQEKTYSNTTKFLIHGVLDGYNATG